MSSVEEHIPCKCIKCIIYSVLRCQCTNSTNATMSYAHNEELNRQAFLHWLENVIALEWPPNQQQHYSDTINDTTFTNPIPVPNQQTQTQTITNENNTITNTPTNAELTATIINNIDTEPHFDDIVDDIQNDDWWEDNSNNDLGQDWWSWEWPEMLDVDDLLHEFDDDDEDWRLQIIEEENWDDFINFDHNVISAPSAA